MDEREEKCGGQSQFHNRRKKIMIWVPSGLIAESTRSPRDPDELLTFVAAIGGDLDNHTLDGAKFGYVDHNGEWVIPPQFDEAWPFLGGLAQVEFNPMTPEVISGYINRDGKYVWEPRQ